MARYGRYWSAAYAWYAQMEETPDRLRRDIRSICSDLGWSNGDLATFLLQRPHLTLWAYATEQEAQQVIAALREYQQSR